MSKEACEGCGVELHPVYLNRHRQSCDPYREWSKCLPHPCRKGCGMGFSAPRSRANHERKCTGAGVEVTSGCRLCGERYTGTVTEHLRACAGPTTVPVIPDDVEHPTDESCVCGYTGASRSAARQHRVQCASWWAYEKRLPVRCEGCDRGFSDLYGKRSHAQVCSDWQAWRDAKDGEEKTHPCPSCGDLMRGPQLGLHVKSCPGPWTEKDWERHRRQSANKRTELRSDDLVRGQDFVVCAICGDRFRALTSHLIPMHGITAEEYRFKYLRPTFSQRTFDRTRETWMENYGVDHPMKVPEILAQSEETRIATMMERYGASTPMEAGLIPTTMTKPERAVDALGIPGLYYTGNHAYWLNVRTGSGEWKPRNPDFVVYDAGALARLDSGESPNEVRTHSVVEVLGDYWHSEERQGVDRDTYIKARTAEYASVKVRALFVWESEVKSDPDSVRSRLEGFLGVNDPSGPGMLG